MGRKYIVQQQDINFVYPNNILNQYDVEIVHDINDNCVTGTVTNFSAVTFTSTGMTLSFTYDWSLNGATRFLNKDNNATMVMSVHGMRVATYPPVTGGTTTVQSGYYNPWRILTHVTGSTVATTQTATVTTGVLTPSMFGLTGFTSDSYVFEFRMIGEDCVLPICKELTLTLATPTPTPSPTPTSTPIPPTFTPSPTPTATGTPTPTPTAGPITSTPTPTPTATPAPVGQCYCFPIVVTGTTIPGPEGGTIATLQYNDCYGTLTARAFTVGPGTYYQCIQVISSVVQYDPIGTTGIDQSYLTLTYLTGNCNTGYVCTGYTPASTATPTPTPTGVPPTDTPTPTPTGVPPTDTPTPTPTATPLPPTDTPTPTPTSTPTPTPFETTFSGFVSLENGPSACGGGEYSNVNITVVGTTLCNATKVKGLSSPTYGNVYSDMIVSDTFWVSNGTDEREFMRDGSANTGTPQTACTACAAPTATPTPTPTATPTPTPGSYTSFGGCGYGANVAAACNDAGVNARTLYSNCDNVSIGVGCIIYSDAGGTTPLTGYTNVYLALQSWDVNSSTGAITALSSEQC